MESLNERWSDCWVEAYQEGRRLTKLPGFAAEKLITNLSCPECRGLNWKTYHDSQPVYDLKCRCCKTRFQVKASKDLRPRKNGGDLVIHGTTYRTTYKYAGKAAYIIVSYIDSETIRKIYYVKSKNVTPNLIKPSTPVICRGCKHIFCIIRFKKGMYKSLVIHDEEKN